MGMGSGNFGNLIGNIANKGGAVGAPPFTPFQPDLPYANDPYRPNYSYAAGPSYGNYQLPYSSGPYGSNYIPTPGGVSFGQKGGTMSPGFEPPGRMLGTFRYGRYPGSSVGYYDPTPEPNYNPSRPTYSNPNPVMPGPPAKGGPDIPYVGLPNPPMPGPPAKGLPTPAVRPPQPKGGAF